MIGSTGHLARDHGAEVLNVVLEVDRSEASRSLVSASVVGHHVKVVETPSEA